MAISNTYNIIYDACCTLIGVTDDTISDADSAKLAVLIEQVVEEVCGFTNQPCIYDNLYYTASQMVMIKWSKAGNEGLASASYGGVNESYLSDYPPSIIKALSRRRKLGVI